MAEKKQPREPAFKPFIPADRNPPEFTLKAVTLGVLLGLLFSAVTVYLGLRAGLTIAVNIPISITAMAVFSALTRAGLAKKASVLEINTVQTVGAAGESIAAGVIFTLPALFFLGFVLDASRIFIVALAGGLLGVCYLVPLRRYLIEKEHGILPYPEGVACAEVIKSGAAGGSRAAKVLWGSAAGFVYKLAMGGGRFWKEIPEWKPRWFPGSTFNAEISPELLGVGYIIGPKTASVMVAGGFLSWVLLIPMIKFFGAAIPMTLDRGGELVQTTVGALTDDRILWRQYIRYIGAGAVVAGGFINLVRAFPTIVGSFRGSVRDMRKSSGKKVTVERTGQDLPLGTVFTGVAAAIAGIWFLLMAVINPGHAFGNAVSALLIAVFGFFFATVSSRLVGEIGVSSNPTSGMTIATLMATCLVFLAVGWTGGAYAAVALSVGAVVCICASNAGNVAQSLKTGFLLGCTPKKQEIGYALGALSSIAVVGFTVLAVNKAYTTFEPVASLPPTARVERAAIRGDQTFDVYADAASGEKFWKNRSDGSVRREQPGIGSDKLPAPQARLMATVIDGVLAKKLPWALILMGIALTLTVELCGVRGLPFAVGVYLPLSTSAPIFFGGLIRWLVDRRAGRGRTQDESGPGMLYASGLIAGGAVAGLLLAAAAGIGVGTDPATGADLTFADKMAVGGKWLNGLLSNGDGLSMLIFIGLCVSLGFIGWPRKK
jgi:putative OPT family oligopeptide transporter